MQKQELGYISLLEATNFCQYSQEYLSLRARTGKLKAVKFGRNWVTTKSWLDEYVNNVKEYNNSLEGLQNKKIDSFASEFRAAFALDSSPNQEEVQATAPVELISSVPNNLPVETVELKKDFFSQAVLVAASLVASVVFIFALGVFAFQLTQNRFDLSRWANFQLAQYKDSFQNVSQDFSYPISLASNLIDYNLESVGTIVSDSIQDSGQYSFSPEKEKFLQVQEFFVTADILAGEFSGNLGLGAGRASANFLDPENIQKIFLAQTGFDLAILADNQNEIGDLFQRYADWLGSSFTQGKQVVFAAVGQSFDIGAYFLIFLAAFGGGFLRGMVGFVKHQFSYKNAKFNISYFLGMMFVSGIIGATTALAMKEVGFTLFNTFTPALSFIVGYAGGDFIENIYKIIIKKSDFANN